MAAKPSMRQLLRTSFRHRCLIPWESTRKRPSSPASAAATCCGSCRSLPNEDSLWIAIGTKPVACWQKTPRGVWESRPSHCGRECNSWGRNFRRTLNFGTCTRQRMPSALLQIRSQQTSAANRQHGTNSFATIRDAVSVECCGYSTQPRFAGRCRLKLLPRHRRG